MKPFLKIGEISHPKREFPEIIDILKKEMATIPEFKLGGIHRWSPEAYSFEFHSPPLSEEVLKKRWENVYLLPLLKTGIYLTNGTIAINTRLPEFFLDFIGEDVDGSMRYQVDTIFHNFKQRIFTFFQDMAGEIGDFIFVHRSEGADLDEKRMGFLRRLKKSRDIHRERISGDPHASVKQLAEKVTSSFDELEGWKIIDVQNYRYGDPAEHLTFIEFCTPQYAGQAMRMNKIYNLSLPCLGSVRSENGYALINMFLPTFMFRPLFYSVDAETRKANADFPNIVTRIIRETCLKKVLPLSG